MVEATVAAAIAAVLTAGAGHLAIPRLAKLTAGTRVREDTPERHQTKAGTPSMGGLFFIPAACIAAASVGWGIGAIGAVVVSLLAGGLGLVDDLVKRRSDKGRGVKARLKLVAQVGLGVACVAFARGCLGRPDSVPLPFGGEILHPGVGLYVLGALVMASAMNAVNLTDGLDGLAASVCLPVFGAYAVVLGGRGDGVGAATGAAFAGALAAFLWFNRHPARVWMGDTGSMALGGALAALAIFAGLEWLLVLGGLVLVLEALSVVVQVISFQTTGRRVLLMSPLHHHFELKGVPEARIVVGFAVVSVVCSVVGGAVAVWR